MKPLESRDPLKVGVAFVAASAVVVLLIVVLSTVSFGARTYTAHLAQTAGLRVGEDVQVAGVNVGTVRHIRLAGKDVRVEFTLDRKIRLGADTRATVKVATLLGTHLLAIEPRGPGTLKDDSIALANTEVPFNLQDVINQGASTIGKLDSDLLARALTAVTDATEAASDDFGPALRGISRISEVVAVRSTQTSALLQAAQGVSSQLAESSGDLITLMKQTQQVLDEIYARRAAIHVLLLDTTRLARSLTSIASRTTSDVQAALGDLRKVLGMLRAQDATLKRALTLLGPTARYMANAVGSGPWVDVGANNIVPDGQICELEGTC